MFKWMLIILILGINTLCFPEQLQKTPIVNEQIFINILANHQQFTPEVVHAAFQGLQSFSSKTEPHHIPYCKQEEINIIQEVPSSLYGEIVKSMTISCVDTFVYNFEKETYLMVKRTTQPAQGQWWLPGGRIFKGESFYESAVRKTKQESGLSVLPIAQLGTYSTYFPESAWGIPSDTKNTIILALCTEEQPFLDEYHQDFLWVSIDQAPTDPYLLSAYIEAKAKLSELGFTIAPEQNHNTSPFFRAKEKQPYHLSIGAVLFDQKGRIACHHFEEIFGHRDVYILMRETMENHETPLTTLHRGLQEEFGATAEPIAFLGSLVGDLPDAVLSFEKTTLYIACKVINWNPEDREFNDPEANSTIKWLEPAALITLLQKQGKRFPDRVDADESSMIERALPYIKQSLNKQL